ncbi:hypothetical protein IFM89_004579 [Coptis chinensis]|uniref:Uncharacterized protein n=1 Tax=Coptis chinensis TaxID=261450 RepID=A0A835H3F2_9MAGN|nr:hypothetical protein IFM89_004579 [Coptis chinensis]
MTDPLMSWDKDVNWLMGDLSFKKTRHQGKIDGNLQKLREEEEKIEKLRKEKEVWVWVGRLEIDGSNVLGDLLLEMKRIV